MLLSKLKTRSSTDIKNWLRFSVGTWRTVSLAWMLGEWTYKVANYHTAWTPLAHKYGISLVSISRRCIKTIIFFFLLFPGSRPIPPEPPADGERGVRHWWEAQSGRAEGPPHKGGPRGGGGGAATYWGGCRHLARWEEPAGHRRSCNRWE